MAHASVDPPAHSSGPGSVEWLRRNARMKGCVLGRRSLLAVALIIVALTAVPPALAQATADLQSTRVRMKDRNAAILTAHLELRFSNVDFDGTKARRSDRGLLRRRELPPVASSGRCRAGRDGEGRRPLPVHDRPGRQPDTGRDERGERGDQAGLLGPAAFAHAGTGEARRRGIGFIGERGSPEYRSGRNVLPRRPGDGRRSWALQGYVWARSDSGAMSSPPRWK